MPETITKAALLDNIVLKNETPIPLLVPDDAFPPL